MFANLKEGIKEACKIMEDMIDDLSPADSKNTFFDPNVGDDLSKKHKAAIAASKKISYTLRLNSNLYRITNELVGHLNSWNNYINGNEFKKLADEHLDMADCKKQLVYPFKLSGNEENWFSKKTITDGQQVDYGFSAVTDWACSFLPGSKSSNAQDSFAKKIRTHQLGFSTIEDEINEYLKDKKNDPSHTAQCEFFSDVKKKITKTVDFLGKMESTYRAL